jgi:hypothetical protein
MKIPIKLVTVLTRLNIVVNTINFTNSKVSRIPLIIQYFKYSLLVILNFGKDNKENVGVLRKIV